MAYFETNQIILALRDYEAAKKLTIIPPFIHGYPKAMLARSVYIPENKTEFSKGLVLGVTDGTQQSMNDFFPSVFGCCRGVLNGLWAFVYSPLEVSQEMIYTSYAVGEFISSHTTEECLQCVIPELKDLGLSWDKINDYSRGQKIGYIIGKYGMDILAPIGILKGVSKVKALKRANIMCTLECCAYSQVKKAKILEESSKRAITRIAYIESRKNGKIFVKNKNVPYHIMQNKHAWDKITTLSGNIEEDFAKIISFLEENQICDAIYLKGNPELFPATCPKISKAVHQKVINEYTVHVEIETYIETGAKFLQDAWVVTK